MDALVPAGLEGPAALGVFAAEDPGLLVAEGAGVGGWSTKVSSHFSGCCSSPSSTVRCEFHSVLNASFRLNHQAYTE